MSSRSKLLAACGGEPVDPYFANVSLLLHGDGSNGAQNNTFLDSSANNFTITRNGNTTQGSFSPYGDNWAAYFDGSSTLTTSTVSLAGDFTIEGWVYFTGTGDGSVAGALPPNHQALRRLSGKHYFYREGVSVTGTIDVPSNQWVHLAVTRSSGTVRLFTNGVLDGSGSITGTFSIFCIGGLNTTTDRLTGYASNIRVVNGTALYTATFTPSTSPLTAVSGTVLLTCQSNRFRDASTNNFTITRNGNVKVTNFAPFAPSAAYSTSTNGGSAYFDGSGDYLTSTSANTANAMGTGDWTVEGWVYRTSGAADMVIFDTVGVGAASADYIRIFINTGGGVSFWKYSSATTTTSSAMPIGAWSHFAVVRESGSIKIYVNGVQGNTTYTDTGSNYTCSTSRPAIGINGYDAAANAYAGYVSNLRAVKGTAVYTANFTPPTSPVTAISGTSLLLNATNAAIFDNSMKNDLETVGNAQISTSVKKFGTGSLAFDGTGDWVQTIATDLVAFGTGDFTVECFFYPTSTKTAMRLIEFIPAGDNVDLTTNGSGSIGYYNGASSANSTSGVWTLNAWNHIAIVRSSGTVKVYSNGTSVITQATTPNSTSRTLYIGGTTNNHFQGYIDDFRITKGVARYTANFTPPTAAFPNK